VTDTNQLRNAVIHLHFIVYLLQLRARCAPTSSRPYAHCKFTRSMNMHTQPTHKDCHSATCAVGCRHLYLWTTFHPLTDYRAANTDAYRTHMADHYIVSVGVHECRACMHTYRSVHCVNCVSQGTVQTC
jgi:hypothetical protein